MSRQRKIAVIGLGYVGLPVAVAFARQAPVIGFDINAQRVSELRAGYDRTLEVDDGELNNANLHFTDNPEDLARADFFIIAVPTPVDVDKHPDLLPMLRASRTVGRYLKAGDIVMYESTVYPGATEETCVPVLERESGLRCGQDFSVGYSPERINPGDTEHRFETIVKVVAGQDQASLEIIAGVYASVVTAGVHKAPSIKVAEAAKVIENTQRDINIALINELAMIFDRMGIDTHEVLAAAGTKWNFLPFTPGLVGGHCIGIDPYYLIHQALRVGCVPQIIPAARTINDDMGKFLAERVVELLEMSGSIVRDSKVTVLGVAFKENVPDLRNTRVADIVLALQERGIEVQVHDPLVDKAEAREELGLELMDKEQLEPAQCLLLTVAHQDYLRRGWPFIKELLDPRGGIVMDVKAALPREAVPEKVLLWRL